MQAVVGDDPVNAADAQAVAGLVELLPDNFRRGIRIQEAMADDLPHDLSGAAVVGLWPGGSAPQAQGPLGLEQAQQLEVSGLGIAEFGGGFGGAQALAAAFVEHGQFDGDFVLVGHGERTGRAAQVCLV